MRNERRVNRHTLTVISIAAVMLIATTTSMATTANVFAYNRNQATSSANACGNGQVPTNIGCQNTDSSIQGDENSVALTSQQTFPAVEITPPSPPPPPPPEDACLEVEGTIWDITLLAELDGVPAGTVLCLPIAELDVIQDATLVPPPEGQSSVRDVTVTALVAGTSDCPAEFDTQAEVTSGTPPTGVDLGDTVCVKEGGPP